GDNQIYAIDAQTGKLVWETAVLPPKAPASATGGPIIANGKVISGRQCQPAATTDACIVTAHDAKTGKEVWRFRTIPRPGEPGYETWATCRRTSAGTLAPGWSRATTRRPTS